MARHILFSLSCLIFFSCKVQEDDTGFPQKGAYVRLVSMERDVFVLSDFENSSYDFSVEFEDGQNGKSIAQYEILVNFADSTLTSGDQSKPDVLYNRFDASDFKVNEKGYYGLSLSISLAEVAKKLGLSRSDLNAGDAFHFITSLRNKDGFLFNSERLKSPYYNEFFNNYFNFTVEVVE